MECRGEPLAQPFDRELSILELGATLRRDDTQPRPDPLDDPRPLPRPERL